MGLRRAATCLQGLGCGCYARPYRSNSAQELYDARKCREEASGRVEVRDTRRRCGARAMAAGGDGCGWRPDAADDEVVEIRESSQSAASSNDSYLSTTHDSRPHENFPKHLYSHEKLELWMTGSPKFTNCEFSLNNLFIFAHKANPTCHNHSYSAALNSLPSSTK